LRNHKKIIKYDIAYDYTIIIYDYIFSFMIVRVIKHLSFYSINMTKIINYSHKYKKIGMKHFYMK